MKIALYIEDGLEQIVLTPETETERYLVAKIAQDGREIEIKSGSFYDARGGWKRYREGEWPLPGFRDDKDDTSTMIMLRPKVAPAPEYTPAQRHAMALDAAKAQLAAMGVLMTAGTEAAANALVDAICGALSKRPGVEQA